MLNKIHEATNYILSQTSLKPETGIILGTGLGGLVADCDIVKIIDYEDIPNFPTTSVTSH